MSGAVLPIERPSEPASALDASFVGALIGRVSRLARRRAAWLEHLRKSSSGVATARSRDLDLAFADRDDPEAERAFYATNPSVTHLEGEIRAYETVLAEEQRSPLARLARTFALTDGERDLVEVCLALELEPSLGGLFAEIQRGRAYVTDSLAARLCGHGRTELFDPAGPLRRWDIVRVEEAAPGEPAPLRVDPHVVAHAVGRTALDPALLTVASLLEPCEPLASWPVGDLAQRVVRALDRGAPLRWILIGPRASGKKTLAACVSAALGARALGIDTTGVAEADWPSVWLHAHRQAVLSGLALVWHGEQVGRRPPPLLAVAPLQFVTGDAEHVPPPQTGVIDERFELPALDLEERHALWRRLVPGVQGWPPGELDRVVERYCTSVGNVAAIGARGVTEASEAAALCRAFTRTSLGELGQLVDCPFTFEDLVLPSKLRAVLDDFLFEARERVRFWENPAARRLFPRGTGLVALMSGPPGTGKTMAAQVIASELALDLVRIDLATCVSKYIGETAKNLRRIFARAAEMNAVVLFDEADALFTKRTEVKDAHDRYANTDTNYLLQLIEDYGGVALLATNKRQNIDTAFVRRIRYLFEFQRPAATERRVIWQRLVGELSGSPRAVELRSVLDSVADTIELSGAQIKLALLGALFAARREDKPLGLAHLYHGIGRELAKEGRGVSPNERERIDRHG